MGARKTGKRSNLVDTSRGNKGGMPSHNKPASPRRSIGKKVRRRQRARLSSKSRADRRRKALINEAETLYAQVHRICKRAHALNKRSGQPRQKQKYQSTQPQHVRPATTRPVQPSGMLDELMAGASFLCAGLQAPSLAPPRPCNAYERPCLLAGLRKSPHLRSTNILFIVPDGFALPCMPSSIDSKHIATSLIATPCSAM